MLNPLPHSSSPDRKVFFFFLFSKKCGKKQKILLNSIFSCFCAMFSTHFKDKVISEVVIYKLSAFNFDKSSYGMLCCLAKGLLFYRWMFYACTTIKKLAFRYCLSYAFNAKLCPIVQLVALQT